MRFWVIFLLSVVCTMSANFAGSIDLGSSLTRIELVEQNQSELVMSVKLGKIEFLPVSTKEGNFVMLALDGSGRSAKFGEPGVPVIRRIISVPFGCELKAEIVRSEFAEFSLADYNISDLIMPTQPPLSKSADPEAVEFIYSKEIYSKDGYYSLPLAEAYTLGTMRSVHLGMLEISPIEYDPVKNIIRVYKNIEVRVIYENADWLLTQDMQQDEYSPAFDIVYSRIFNYEPPTSALLDTITSYPIKYLIVADRMFQSQLQPFIAWKTKMGYVVTVGYTDVIGSTTTSIKSWIQNQYNSPSDGLEPSFVLLVGDTPQIPTFDGNSDYHVTDMHYVDFTSDDFPEIFIGRFSAQNTGELQPQIDKTLEYEQFTMPDPSYMAEVTLIAGVDAGHAPTYGNGQINYGTTYYFNLAHGITDHTWLYPASDDPGASAAIIQTVDDGIGLINYTAHCGHTGFSDPSFTVSDINSLTNAHKYLLGIGNCCLSNTFDESTPCFGEAWLQAANKGGVGYIGGSNSTLWDEDYWWSVGAGAVTANPTYEATGIGAYDGVFHDHGEPVAQHHVYNSAIIYCGNMAVDEGGGHSQYYWEIYHLMGDPSLMNYMGVPSVNNVSHPSTIIMNASSVNVSAVAGSYVGISINGVLHGAAYVGTSGSVNVPLTAFSSPGTADIVVTAQNRQPYISTIQVVSPSGPYVLLDYYDINDISGNNNGEVDAGESIVLGVQLVNVGPDNANNVSATLSTSDAYVTITDNTENYGTINGNNGTSYSANAFAFSTSTNTPDNHNISFDLEVSGVAIDTWTSNFTIPVHAPDLGFVSVIINDASGNNNGVLDPGESANIIVTIGNDGSGVAGDVSGVLSENDGYVSVTDANGYFGSISGGGTANNYGDVFIASASSGCPQGHEMTFNLNLSAEFGYAANANFNIVVGDRAIIYFDDFSYDQGWSGLGGTGEWTIGSAGGGSGSDDYGGPDPSLDHTSTSDNGVLGNDISPSDGDYNSSMTQTYWVYSPVIDCFDYADVIINYYRWLGIERNLYDTVYFEVYNGASWVTLYQNDTITVDDSTWNLESYDISAYADGNSEFQLRFGIGGTDGSWQYCGWNIDDIEIKGYYQGSAEPSDVAIAPSSLADSLAEGETGMKQLTVSNNGTGNLRFRFTSSPDWIEFDNTQYDIAPTGNHVYDITFNADGLTPGDYSGSLNFACNDPDTPTGSVPVSLHVYAPDIYIAQSSVHENLESGEQSTVSLIIENNGPGRLEYSIDYEIYESLTLASKLSATGLSKTITTLTKAENEPIGYYTPVAGKTKTPEPYYAPMLASSGGPDAFGYSWIDSDESGGPIYSWVDITSVGTSITNLEDDENSGPYPIGFDFNFYGNDFSSFRFCTNGFISFTSTEDEYQNAQIPTEGDEPVNLIAPFWDDMYFLDGGSAYYYSNGSDSLVISWIDVPHYPSTGPGLYTYQAILLGNGKIIFQYQQMIDTTNSATIGIQDNNGTVALQVAYNQDYVHDGLAVQLSAGAQWLDVTPLGGSVAPYNSCTIELHFDATDLADGDYTAQVSVASNDPDTPNIDIPVTLSVGLDAAIIDVSLSSIIDSVGTGQSSQVQLTIGNVGNLNLDYDITDNRSWIITSPDSGTVIPEGSTPIMVTLDASALPEGDYSGQITISSNAINESTIDIPVTMVVIPPPPVPDITLNLVEITEMVVEGNATQVNLIIGNEGIGDLTFSLNDNRSWIIEAPESGIVPETGLDTVVVTLDATSLTDGSYGGTITLTSNDPDEETIQIPVTLNVVPEGPMCAYKPGDVNGDGATIGGDVTFSVNYFRGITVPVDSCWRESNQSWLYVAGDVNGDCQFVGADVTYLVNFFRGLTEGLLYCPELPPYESTVIAVPIEIEKESILEETVVVPSVKPDKPVKAETQDKLK